MNEKEEVQNLISSALKRDREIQDGKGPSLVKEILDKREDNTPIYSKKRNPLPQWFSTAYRNKNLPSWMLLIPCNHEFIHLALVEEKNRPYSLLSAIDIFRAMSAILLSVDYPDISWLSSGSAEAVGIELSVRVGDKLIHNTIPFYNNESKRVPQLSEIPKLSPLVRLDFFKDVLKVDEAGSGVVDLFPENIKIFICSIIFWVQVFKSNLETISKPSINGIDV
jgi:hypothetical protein